MQKIVAVMICGVKLGLLSCFACMRFFLSSAEAMVPPCHQALGIEKNHKSVYQTEKPNTCPVCLSAKELWQKPFLVSTSGFDLKSPKITLPPFYYETRVWFSFDKKSSSNTHDPPFLQKQFLISLRSIVLII